MEPEAWIKARESLAKVKGESPISTEFTNQYYNHYWPNVYRYGFLLCKQINRDLILFYFSPSPFYNYGNTFYQQQPIPPNPQNQWHSFSPTMNNQFPPPPPPSGPPTGTQSNRNVINSSTNIGSYNVFNSPNARYPSQKPTNQNVQPTPPPPQPPTNNGTIRFNLQHKSQPKKNFEQTQLAGFGENTSQYTPQQQQQQQQQSYTQMNEQKSTSRTPIDSNSSNNNATKQPQGLAGFKGINNNSINGQPWSKELEDYAKRAFRLSNDKIDQDRIEIILKGKITKALKDGTMYTKDWKNEPLPVLTKTTTVVDNKAVPNSNQPLKQTTTQSNSSPFRSFETSKVIENKTRIKQTSPGKSSYSSGSYTDSSDSESNYKIYGKRSYCFEEKPSKKKKNKLTNK